MLTRNIVGYKPPNSIPDAPNYHVKHVEGGNIGRNRSFNNLIFAINDATPS